MGGNASLQAWLELERGSLQNAWRNAAMKRAEQLEEEAAHPQAAELLKGLLEADALAEDVLQRYLKNAYLAGQRSQAITAYDRFASHLRGELGLLPLEETVQLANAIEQAAPLVHSLRAAKPKATVPLSVLRPPRLVGRDDALRGVARTTSDLVLIVGEPGIGKSRLLFEIASGVPLLRCREGLARVPYQPVAGFIRNRLADQAALGGLGAYLGDLARLIPEAAPDITPPPADAQTGKTRLLEALALYLEAVAPPEQGFGLVFDDLQWADPATLELLVYLAGRKGLRILGAYRDNEVSPALKEVLDSLTSNGRLSTLLLKPLPPHEVKTLLAELMGGGQGPELFSRWLHQSTGGNPLFALETLKSLFESGVLRADETSWHSSIDELTQDYRELEVPPAVTEVIQRRVSRLSEPAQRTLQLASVVREGFAPQLLQKIAGLSAWAVMEALEEAEASGLLRGEAFVHDLLRQSVYRSLPEARRRLMHGKVAGALEGTAEPVVVAEHWLEGGEPERAVRLWLQAADALDALSLIADANGLLERAARYTADAKERNDIKVRLAGSYREAGRYAESQKLLDEALKEPLEPRTRADALIEQAWLHLNFTKLEEAAAAATEAEAIVLGLGDPSLELDLAKLRSNIAFRGGRYEASCAFLEPAAARLRQEPPGRDLAGLLTSIGAAYDRLGRFADALPLHRESLSIAQAIGSHYYQVDAASNLLRCLRWLGRAEEGLAAAETALQLGRYQGSDNLRNSLALAYASLGRSSEAAMLDEHLAHKSENPLLCMLAWTRLARDFYGAERKLEASHALGEAIRRLPTVEVASARAGVVILALNRGDGRQKEAVKPYLQPLLDGALADELRQELEQALLHAM